MKPRVLCAILLACGMGCGDDGPVDAAGSTGAGSTGGSDSVGDASDGSAGPATGDDGDDEDGDGDGGDTGSPPADCDEPAELELDTGVFVPPSTAESVAPPCGELEPELTHVQYYRVTVPARTALFVNAAKEGCGEGPCQGPIVQLFRDCEQGCVRSSVGDPLRAELFGVGIRYRNDGDRPLDLVVAVGQPSSAPGPYTGAWLIASLHPFVACEDSGAWTNNCYASEGLSALDAEGSLPGCAPDDAALVRGALYRYLSVPADQYALVRTYPGGCGSSESGPAVTVEAKSRLLDACDGACLTTTDSRIRWFNDTGSDASVVIASGPDSGEGQFFGVEAIVGPLAPNAICDDAPAVVTGDTFDLHLGEGTAILSPCGAAPALEYPVFFRATLPPGQEIRAAQLAGHGYLRATRFLTDCAAGLAGVCLGQGDYESSNVVSYTNDTGAALPLIIAVEPESSSAQVRFVLP